MEKFHHFRFKMSDHQSDLNVIMTSLVNSDMLMTWFWGEIVVKWIGLEFFVITGSFPNAAVAYNPSKR